MSATYYLGEYQISYEVTSINWPPSQYPDFGKKYADTAFTPSYAFTVNVLNEELSCGVVEFQVVPIACPKPVQADFYVGAPLGVTDGIENLPWLQNMPDFVVNRSLSS